MVEGAMQLDDAGWLVGTPEPRPIAEAYAVLAPEDDSRFHEARWQQQARRFFAAELTLATPKRYPGGGRPRADAAVVELGMRGGERGRVEVLTMPLDRAAPLRAAALEASASMSGFDALVRKAQRLWQLAPVEPAGEPRASLALSAVLASSLLGPILPPEGTTLLGVKSARERLAACGWPT